MLGFNSIVIPKYYQNENNMKYNNNDNLHQRVFNLESNISENNECNLMELGLNNQVFNQPPNINMTISPKRKKRPKKNGGTKKKKEYNILNSIYFRFGLLTILGISLFSYYYHKQ